MVSRVLLPDYLTPTIDYVKDNFLSKKFERKNYLNPDIIRDFNVLHLEMSNGEVIEIPRPNHGTPHSARVAAYVPLIVEFLKKHGAHNYNFINDVNYLSPDNIYHLQIAALFSVTGRLDETGFNTGTDKNNNTAKIKYRSYRQTSANAMLDYGIHVLCDNYNNAEYWSSVVLEMGNTPFIFNDEKNLKEQEEIFPIPKRPAHIVDMILHIAHCMDLFRCHNLTSDNPLDLLRWNCTQTHPDFIKDYTQLMQFAVTAILKTGNKIKYYMDNEAKIKEAGSSYLRYQDNFLACNNNVEYLMYEINSIPLPQFYSGQEVSYTLPVENNTISIKSSKLPIQNIENRKPIAHYLDEAAIFNAADGQGGVYVAFAEHNTAVQCLLSIKNLLKLDKTLEKASVSRYNYKKTDTPWRFRLMHKQYSALTIINEALNYRIYHRSRAQTLTPKDDIYIKHVRCDEFGFYYPFTRELLDTSYRLEKRKGTKKNIRVNGLGPNRRTDNVITSGYPCKKSKYTADIKKNYTKSQSTTLAFKEHYSPVFGWDKRESLVIFMFGKHSVLLSDYLTIYDNGTVNRPFDVNLLEKAQEINDKVGKTIFKADDLTLFKQALTSTSNKGKHNEALARLQWLILENNRNEENKIAIAKDNFETRMLAKQYALSLEFQLKQAGKCDPEYHIPVVFYTPDDTNLLFGEYTFEEYEFDCLQARTIKNDEILRQEKYKNNRYEFLLGLSPEVIKNFLMTEKMDSLSLPLHILNNGYTQIFLFLQEKSGLSLETILGNALIDQKDNQKLMLSMLYYALMGEALYLAEYIDKKIDFAKFTKVQELTEKSPLMAAVDKNHLPWVKRLLGYQCINRNIKHDRLDSNAFYTAIYYNRPEMVKEFIKDNTSVHTCINHPKSPLYFTVEYGSAEIVKILVGSGAQDISHNSLSKPSDLAFANQRFDVLGIIFNCHPDISVSELARACASKSANACYDSIIDLSLFKSIENNDKKEVTFYLDLIFSSSGIRKISALNHACSLKHFDCVQAIAESGSPTISNLTDYQETFCLAAQNNAYECAQALLNKINKYYSHTDTGTFLHHAIQNNDDDTVKLLSRFNNHLALMHKNIKRQTPIQLAYANKKYNHIKLLAVPQDDNNSYGYNQVVIDALIANDMAMFDLMLNSNASINSQNEASKNSLLHIAILTGNKDVLKKLLKSKNINLAMKDLLDRTPIQLAFDNIPSDFVELIAESRNTDDADTYCYGNVLVYAVKNNSYDLAYTLLNANASTNHHDMNKNTVYHLAVQNNDEKMLRLLLKYKTHNLAIKNLIGDTPIQMAAGLGHHHLVKLIAENVKTDALDLYNYGGALINIVSNRELDCARILLNAGASLAHCKSDSGNTVLHEAIQNNDDKMVNLLLEYDLSIDYCLNYKNKKQQTPVQLAYDNKYDSLVSLIVLARRTDKQDSFGYNQVAINATRDGKLDLVLILLNAGVSINTVDPKSGNSLLHLAIFHGHSDLVSSLISFKNIDITIRNKQGLTCIKLAFNCNQPDTIKVISNTIKADQGNIDEYRNALLEFIKESKYDLAKYIIKSGVKIWHKKVPNFELLLNQVVADNETDLTSYLLGYEVDLSHMNKKGNADNPVQLDYALRSCATNKNAVINPGYIDNKTFTKDYNQLLFEISVVLIQGERQSTSAIYSLTLPVLQSILHDVITICGLFLNIKLDNNLHSINSSINKISRDCFLNGYYEISLFKRTRESKNLVTDMEKYKTEPKKINVCINQYLNIFTIDPAKHAEPMNLLIKYHLAEEKHVNNQIQAYTSLVEGKKEFANKLLLLSDEIKNNPDSLEFYYERACHYKSQRMLNLALTDYIKAFDVCTAEINKPQILGETIESLFATAEKVDDFNGISKYKLFDLIKTLPEKIQISLLGTCLETSSLLHLYLKRSTNLIGGLLRSVNLDEYTGSEKLLLQMDDHLKNLKSKNTQDVIDKDYGFVIVSSNKT